MVFIYYPSITSGRMALVWRSDPMAKGRADTSPWRSHLCVCWVNQSRVTERTWESQVYQVKSSSTCPQLRKTHPKIQLGWNLCLYIAARERNQWSCYFAAFERIVSELQSACLADAVTFKCWHTILFWINTCGRSWEQKYQSRHGINVMLLQYKHSCFLAQYWQTPFSNMLLFSWSQKIKVCEGDQGNPQSQ